MLEPIPSGTVSVGTSAVSTHNGFLMNGLGANGVAFNNINLNGMSLNGMSLNGMSLNGMSLNGMSLNGHLLNGMSLNGMSLNGMSLNGMSLNGMSLDDMSLDGEDVSADTQANVLHAVRYLAACALGPGQCIEVHDLSGVTHTYCGVEGLDTTWDVSEPDLTQSDEIAECFLDLATAEGHDAQHEPVDVEAFKGILEYLVECALPAGDSITVYDENDQPLVLDGAIGLAPGWRDDAPSGAEQRRVTACLAARSNAVGKTVHISLRSEYIPSSPVERDLFDTHEGAFMGDVFADTAYVRTCLVSGGGLSGRTCAEGSACGFESLGDCMSVCSSYDPVEGAYSDCSGEDEVINTHLNLGDEIAFGDRHNCLIQENGSLWCFGRNKDGQLGLGFTSKVQENPTQVAGLSDVAEVVGGKKHTCARIDDGTAYCWGEGKKGRLGDGTWQERSSPVGVVDLGSDVARIAALKSHSCAVKTDGTLWCWGSNKVGQLGVGGGPNRPQPVQVTALGAQVASVSLGALSRTTCAIDVSGGLWCWGRNNHGQVGDGSSGTRDTPVAITEDEDGNPFDNVTDVCGGDSHTCARRSDGTVYCWGRDNKNQLGDGSPSGGDRHAPVQVAFPGFAAPAGLACGDDHTCAIRDDGALFCWGHNKKGELGNGTFDQVDGPVRVRELGSRVARVSLASQHSCATLIDGDLLCWGRDPAKLLIPGPKTAVPVPVTYACDGN